MGAPARPCRPPLPTVHTSCSDPQGEPTLRGSRPRVPEALASEDESSGLAAAHNPHTALSTCHPGGGDTAEVPQPLGWSPDSRWVWAASGSRRHPQAWALARWGGGSG